jgi:hypothetical protein
MGRYLPGLHEMVADLESATVITFGHMMIQTAIVVQPIPYIFSPSQCAAAAVNSLPF